MKIINLRMHQLRNLKELELEPGTFNTEALMLILNKNQAKTKSGGRMLFKYLDAQDDEKVMARKMYTINMLNGSEKYNSINELIIPDHIVVVDGKIAGFALPLIENHKNLGKMLNNEDIALEKKLPYIIQLGNLIDKVERVHNESFRMQFGDLNEFNFIIDKNDKVKSIDLDSAYLGQDEPSNSAYYLLKNKYITALKDKYKTTKNGIIIPTDNSDLYCYNMIILNTLAKESVFKVDIPTYYMYLNHLKDIGIDKELVKNFERIYLPVNNKNPKDLLESINSNLEEDMNFKTFKKEYKIR